MNNKINHNCRIGKQYHKLTAFVDNDTFKKIMEQARKEVSLWPEWQKSGEFTQFLNRKLK